MNLNKDIRRGYIRGSADCKRILLRQAGFVPLSKSGYPKIVEMYPTENVLSEPIYVVEFPSYRMKHPHSPAMIDINYGSITLEACVDTIGDYQPYSGVEIKLLLK